MKQDCLEFRFQKRPKQTVERKGPEIGFCYTHQDIAARRQQYVGACLCFLVAHKTLVFWISAVFPKRGIPVVTVCCFGSICHEFLNVEGRGADGTVDKTTNQRRGGQSVVWRDVQRVGPETEPSC